MLDDYRISHRIHTMEDTPETQSTKLQSKRVIYSAEYTQAVCKVSSILIQRNKLRGVSEPCLRQHKEQQSRHLARFKIMCTLLGKSVIIFKNCTQVAMLKTCIVIRLRLGLHYLCMDKTTTHLHSIINWLRPQTPFFVSLSRLIINS